MSASSVSNEIKCPECNKTFKHKNSIYNHRKTCKKIDICVEIKKSKEEIKEIKKKYKITKVNCDICNKSISQGNLSTHKKTHEDDIKISSKNYSLEETYDFLMWLHESRQYFINSLDEFKDAFNIYKKINPIIKDDKIIISLNFNDVIQEPENEFQEPSLIINDEHEQEPSLIINDEQEPSLIINDEQEPSLIINDEHEPSLIINDEQEPSLIINDEQEQEPSLIINDEQEPSLIINDDIQEENIIIAVCEENDFNIFEEDEELEYYCDEYTLIKELPNNKKDYTFIKPNTSEHYFFKANKFIDRFKKNNLIEHEIKDLKKCQLSIFKLKESINSLIRLTDDEICSEIISQRTKELINNNLLTKILFSAIKIKYKELEYNDEDFDKNKILKKIFNELNDMKDNIPDILEKKWKQLEKMERKNNY